MNKAITDGLVLMPPPFVDGLSVWSSGNGTPGSDTYAGAGGGVYVAADQHFDGCLEILKSDAVQKVRYMGETTILPGCYLRVSVRVKAISGPLPSVRIAGWAGKSGGAHVSGVTEVGPATALTTYGEVVEVSAIIGTGYRDGVDMTWDGAIYGHIGLDLTGATGGIVRIDDIVIEDITNVFIRDMMGVVDVRDYGAKGDGTTDDSAAFEAADQDANGREVLVSAGTYRLADNVTIDNQIRFEGTVTMPANKMLVLRKNFDFVTYADAFGDEDTAFRKAYQALVSYSDHDSLDLNGRRISLKAPVDMQAADGAKTSFATRRVIRNGQFEPVAGSAWNTTTVTSKGTYAVSNPKKLTGVVNAANVPVGSLVVGSGVGREVYVQEVNIAQQTITLSQPLYDAEGTQTYTFKRFKYLLDFSGYESLSSFVFDDVEFKCDGVASGIMLAKEGLTFHLRDCFVNKPKDRGITSIGGGCQGMMIDRCQFISNEMDVDVADRTTIGFNANANDVKIRDCRTVRFKHFCVLVGTGNLISGNHWFHGDTVANGPRMGGVIFTTPNVKSIITGNYIDNNFIEWTNEHSESPALGNQYSFGGLTITGNIFTANDVAPWFNWIVIKPYGPNHYIHGFSVISNTFRTLNGSINRVESVDTTFADLNYGRMRNVAFWGNTFNGVNYEAVNPANIEHTQNSVSKSWVVDAAPYMPFGGRARVVEAVSPAGKITTSGGAAVFENPWIDTEYGSNYDQFRVMWGTDVKGTIRARVRMDNPL